MMGFRNNFRRCRYTVYLKEVQIIMPNLRNSFDTRPFKWIFMGIVPSTATKSLTSDTNFSKHLLIVDAYSNISKLYGMEKITTEKVMDKLDMFQSRFGKIDQFGWWDLERISADAGTHFTSTEFKSLPAWPEL